MDVPVEPVKTTSPPQSAPKAADTRGKLQVVISDEGFEAGRVHTVSIIVSNPFDVPVEILDIESPQSSHLGRLSYARETTTERPEEKANNVKPSAASASTGGWSTRISRFFRAFSEIGQIAVGSVTFGGVSVKMNDRPESQFHLETQEDASVELDQSLTDYNRVFIGAAKGASVIIRGKTVEEVKAELAAANPQAGSQTKTVIEPHCEIVAYIPLVATSWLFFKPLRMGLTYLIRFRFVNDTTRTLTQVVSSSLDVRPPLRSVVIGSILGALLGAIARFTQEISKAGGDVVQTVVGHTSAEIVQLLGAAIMGTIAAVALSRKSGAQSFITVEDFFGGFVVGVLIGYQGSSYFDTIIGHLGTPPQSPGSPPPPVPPS